jgi:hypothetical protein
LEHDPQWQLLALSPVDCRDFFGICSPEHIPSLAGASPDACLRRPVQLGASGWQRIGPTCHAFAWVYRAALMRDLLAALEKARRPARDTSRPVRMCASPTSRAR